MLRDIPELAVARNSEGQTTLHLLAPKPLIFAIKRASGRWKSYVSSCIYYKRNLGSTFLSFLLETIQKQDDPQKIKDLLALPSPVLHLAAEAGNLEFSATLIESYPALVYQKNESKQNFLHIAAKHHQLGMFSLVDKVPGLCLKELIGSPDGDYNNILHFAAMLPPPSGLDAMLQMKRDQKWFKNFQAVMKLVPAQCLDMKNSEGKTPFDILKEARDEGLFPSPKSWLVNVANMSTIVSTFIAIVFAFGWFPSHKSEHNC